MRQQKIKIGNRLIGEGEPTYIVAEMSANHLQDYNRAEAIIRAAKEAGADAVKLQTYTADTITMDCDNEYFQIKQGTIWDGQTCYELFQEAYTPWEWRPKLVKLANDLGMDCFSSPLILRLWISWRRWGCPPTRSLPRKFGIFPCSVRRQGWGSL